MPISIAEEKDISSLVALMDSAYRGEDSKKGLDVRGISFYWQ